MTAADIPITVVVSVKNEEANLDRCLTPLARFREVIVVDSSSTDRSPSIAAAHGAKVLNFEWDGRYPKKRNWILLTQKLAHDWVLFLDADECVTDAFCDAAKRAVQNKDIQGYWLNYTNYFLGKSLRFGVPQRKLALFRVGAGLYERIDEKDWSRLDMEVHEHPVISGRVEEIRDPILHNDDRGLLKFIDRHRDYAAWEAHRTMALRSGPVDAWERLTPRQRFKYRNVGRWWYPPLYFILQYVLKLGALDGSAGLQYAFYKFWYFNTIRLLLRAPGTITAPNDDQSGLARLPERAVQ